MPEYPTYSSQVNTTVTADICSVLVYFYYANTYANTHIAAPKGAERMLSILNFMMDNAVFQVGLKEKHSEIPSIRC